MGQSKGTRAEAIRYAPVRWDGLARYLDNGRIDLDSNVAERLIQPIAPQSQESPACRSDDVSAA